jgi:hypothetical protein
MHALNAAVKEEEDVCEKDACLLLVYLRHALNAAVKEEEDHQL